VHAAGTPISFGVSADGSAAFAAEVNGVERFERHADGTLSSKAVTPAPPGGLPWALAVSPEGHSVYVTDWFSSGPNGLWQFGLAASGELEALSPPSLDTGAGPAAIAIATQSAPAPAPAPPAGSSPLPASTAALVAPTANALAVRGKRSRHGERFAFDGTLSADPDGRIVSYRWTLDGRVIATTARFGRFFSSARRSYRLTLTVVDDHGLSASTAITVSPRARSAPVVHVTIPATATFCLDCAQPSPAMAALVRGLRRYARGARLVSIASYADATGTRAYNLALTRRRTQAIARVLLTGLSPAPHRIGLSWHGESNPIASNATAAGRARNRRSVIRIVR
jgi:YD repeat-containing protein